MTEQLPLYPLGNDLFYELEIPTHEHPMRYIILVAGEVRIPLDKTQALALFRVMINPLGEIASEEMDKEHLLEDLNRVAHFHSAMKWLESLSGSNLATPKAIKDATAFYHNTYDLYEQMEHRLHEWDADLSEIYQRLDAAAALLGIGIDDEDEE